jgi:hypothetical protein
MEIGQGPNWGCSAKRKNNSDDDDNEDDDDDNDDDDDAETRMFTNSCSLYHVRT